MNSIHVFIISADNFIIHEDETHRYLQVYSQPQTVLRVSDDGKISLSMGQAELHTSSQKTNSRVKIYLEVYIMCVWVECPQLL